MCIIRTCTMYTPIIFKETNRQALKNIRCFAWRNLLSIDGTIYSARKILIYRFEVCWVWACQIYFFFFKKSLLKINHHIGLCSYKSLQKQLEMDICDSVMSNENVSIIWHYYWRNRHYEHGLINCCECITMCIHIHIYI